MRDLTPGEFSEELEESSTRAHILDVRTKRERAVIGEIAGSRLVGGDELIERAAELIPDKSSPVFIYCERGLRSKRAGESLEGLGYSDVRQLEGGLSAWRDQGMPVVGGVGERYSRNALLSEIGWSGQERIRSARVLIVGLGALGSPAALYLAAAGVGTLGLVDDDQVDLSNLQRQIIHATDRVGELKVDSAAAAIRSLNPDVEIELFPERLTADNSPKILSGWDVIVDGADNFPVRYLINDRATGLGIPVVSASILGFTGQLSVFGYDDGPCYRCLYPEPPPPELAPSCSENGVIGALPGVIGSMQALEVIKLTTGAGRVASGELILYEGLTQEMTKLNIRRYTDCPACGPGRDEAALNDMDYAEFCGAPVG